MTDPALPDPGRVGGPDWLRSTGGVLTGRQRRRMAATALATQVDLLGQRLGPRRRTSVDLAPALNLPESRLVAEAVDAAQSQAPEVLRHSYRTVVFGRALALIDGVSVDHELLTVCGLLHDSGLERAVVGEDFTVRSAATATAAAGRAGRDDAAPALEDAISVHATVGIDAAHDGALGYYTQAGAMVDLVGLRERHLPHDLIARTVAEHPRAGLAEAIIAAVQAEARAVPGGRFAFLRRVGFGPAIRLASVPSRT